MLLRITGEEEIKKLTNLLLACFIYFHDGRDWGGKWHLVNVDKIISITGQEVKIKGALDISFSYRKRNDVMKEIFSQIKKCKRGNK